VDFCKPSTRLAAAVSGGLMAITDSGGVQMNIPINKKKVKNDKKGKL